MEDITMKCEDLLGDLRKGRTNLIVQGVDVPNTAGISEVMDKILDIQTTASTGTVTDDSMSMIKQVPLNSISHCYVKSIGGMTYKCNNLIPFPYYGGKDVGYTETSSGITFTVNADRSITINGTSNGSSFVIANQLGLPATNYTLSATCVSGTWPTGLYVSGLGGSNYVTPSKPTVTVNMAVTWLSINIEAGTTVNNVTLKIMLNPGSTKLPYEPFYEGLQDNKVTAIKSYGSNLLDFEAALKYWKMSYTKEGNSFTTTTPFDNGYSHPYKFTDKAGVCTISLTSISVIGMASSRIDIGYMDENGSFTRKGAFYLSGATTSYTTPSEVNAIRLNYSSVTGEAISVTFNELRINRGTAVAPYAPYRAEPTTYLIPESLQGTGKGVEGASDTIDFETSKETISCTTVTFDGTEPWDYRADYNCVIMSRTLSKVGKGSAYIITSAPMYLEFSNSSNNRFSFGKRTDAIENYGITSAEDWQNYLAERYASGNPVTVTYAIADPIETDIDTFAFDPLIKVEGGGSLEIITDNGGAVPTSIIYQTIV